MTLTLLAVLFLLLGLFAGMWAQPRVSGQDAHRLSDTDVAFARTMLAAHAEALLVSGRLPDDAAPDVRHVADQVMASQWRAAGQLTGWLEASGVTDPGPFADTGHGHEVPAAAPGRDRPATVSPEELRRLDGLDGAAGEEYYLRLMLRHQEESVRTIAAAAESLTAPAVRRATEVMTGDRLEAIELVARVLAARGVEPLPPGWAARVRRRVRVAVHRTGVPRRGTVHSNRTAGIASGRGPADP